MQSEPTGIPSSQVWKRTVSGCLDWLRALMTSPFQAWWIQAEPPTRLGAAFVE